MTPILLDEALPLRAAALLRELGLDAVHVEEVQLQGSDDAAILARSLADRRTCVTLDADFHRILSFTGAAQPSVIRLRIQHLRAQRCAELIVHIIEQVGPEVPAGVAVSVSATKIRLRRLPLRPSAAQ